MYTAVKRLNAVLTFALSAVMLLIVAISVASLALNTSADVSTIVIRHSAARTAVDQFVGARHQVAEVAFDLTADLSGLFHWNTRYVYASIVAHYQTKQMTTNDVVVFDKVIGRDAPRRLRLSDKRHKYPLADYNMGLAGNNITYSLHCSLIPNAGLLLSSRWGATTVRVPLQ